MKTVKSIKYSVLSNLPKCTKPALNAVKGPAFRINLFPAIFFCAFTFFPPWGGQRGAAQNIGINVTGAAPSSANMLEVLQTSTTDSTIGIYSNHSGNTAGRTYYGLQAIANGTAGLAHIAAYLSASGATNNYALIVPSGGGNVGIGISTPSSTLHTSGSTAQKVATVTAASYTAASETHILANAASNAITITLPAASTVTDRIYYIKKTDATANVVTIDANASETIDGALTKTLSVQYANMSLICDGSNWYVENASSGTIINNGTTRPVALSTQTWSSVNWSTCYSNCEGLTESGYSDWHMPSGEEGVYAMMSLGWNAATRFWTTSGDLGNDGDYVLFRPSDGYWLAYDPTAAFGDCRCVR